MVAGFSVAAVVGAVVAAVGTAPAQLCVFSGVQKAYGTDNFSGCLQGMYEEAIKFSNPDYIKGVRNGAWFTGVKLKNPEGISEQAVQEILSHPGLQ
ncbi:MAG: hypothetical protein LRY54_04340 [Alphaproteobacteria bacterium]|nr:hypothetical protein [Alphaproteobacteria bacterium]